MVMGEEVGEREQTPHLQGFVQLTKKRRLTTLKRLFGVMELHLEPMRGTPKEASDYCKKDNQWTEFGTIQTQGQRTDLFGIQEALQNGATDLEIATEYFPQWIRYGKRFQEYRDLINQRITTPNFALETFSMSWREKIENHDWNTVMILQGENGIGKTEFALALLPGALVVSHMDDLVHFKSSVHSGIIFDDMSFEHMPRHAQIHICDATIDRSIHVRYTVARIPSFTKKIITTNTGDIFLNDPAINRRITWYNLENPRE